MGIQKLKFREANLGDLPRLLEFEQCVVEAERPLNSAIKAGKVFYYDIENLITSSESDLIVAEDEGSIIASGYAQIRKSGDHLKHDIHSYLGFMYVSPHHRGQGVIDKIIEQLIIWSRSKGANDLYLDVYSRNMPAIKAYERAGFEPCLTEMKLSLDKDRAQGRTRN